MKDTKLPELLAPCGSPEVLDAAILGGADAVYAGGTMFNARMNAKNFDRSSLERALEKCHENGVKLYVTFNTLIYDRQMKDALSYAEFLYNIGIDALIVADLGLASQLQKYIPELHLHASTQASGHNADAAKELAGRGFRRMVCARELSSDNIKTLVAASPIEIEMFVHGALCVCHSGQCLMSSIIGGRSGNRGECAQPCRLPYNGRYPLSLKDNCLAGHITEIIDSGVASLKIEGRMKSADYVYSAVSAYRRLLDERRNASPAEIAELAKVFSRGGFTDAYFTGKISPSMLGVRSENDKSETEKASVKFTNMKEERSQLLTEKRDFHLPDAACPRNRAAKPAKKARSARFYNPDNIPDTDFFDIIYLPLDRFVPGKANGMVLPPVITDHEIPTVKKALEAAYRGGARHALVGNIGHISLASEAGFVLHGDFRLNIYSGSTFEAYGRSFQDIILSPELILPQIRDIAGEKSVIVYGRLPLMLLEKPVGTELLRDRRRVSFPVIHESGRDLVINSVPLYMADKGDQLAGAGIVNQHFIFTTEGKHETEAIINAYIKGLPTKKEIKRIK